MEIIESQPEHQIEYGVPITEGAISAYSLEIGNCLEVTGSLGTRYIFEVTNKTKIKGFEDHEEFEKYDVYVQCVYGKGSLRNAAGIIVNSDGRIRIGGKLYIGDANTHTSNFKEMIVWEARPNMDDIPPIEYGERIDWLDTRALVDGDYVSLYEQGGFYVLMAEGEDEKTGKALLWLKHAEYHYAGGDFPWKGGALYGEILASNLAARIGSDIKIGQLESIKITKGFPSEDLNPPKKEKSEKLEKPVNPFLSGDAIMSQAGITLVELDEISQPTFSEIEQKVLRILGFSSDLSVIANSSELLKDTQAYYLEQFPARLATADESQKAELGILRDIVAKGVESILSKLKTS